MNVAGVSAKRSASAKGDPQPLARRRRARKLAVTLTVSLAVLAQSPAAFPARSAVPAPEYVTVFAKTTTKGTLFD